MDDFYAQYKNLLNSFRKKFDRQIGRINKIVSDLIDAVEKNGMTPEQRKQIDQLQDKYFASLLKLIEDAGEISTRIISL